jgi:hypothetical protein
MIDEDEERARVSQQINRPASHKIPDTPDGVENTEDQLGRAAA